MARARQTVRRGNQKLRAAGQRKTPTRGGAAAGLRNAGQRRVPRYSDNVAGMRRQLVDLLRADGQRSSLNRGRVIGSRNLSNRGVRTELGGRSTVRT